MAPAKNASGGAKGGKGKANKKDASSDDATAGDKGKGKSGSGGKGLKPATSINVRHILVGGILILIPFHVSLFCFGVLYYCFLYRTHSFILFGISTTSICYGSSCDNYYIYYIFVKLLTNPISSL